ncbi:MAG: type I restriction enzyme HsdR N-terminal domain-containing protein [Chitinophagales bacterium]|nr:type I restriction enzyme HsdR N-terminal domain-containing protein [Chitinophagales bacterium]
MTEVVFGKYKFRTGEQDGRKVIFDEVRKKPVALTPEEWVRQHILHYLIYDKQYPKSLIAVEKSIEMNGLQKRFDVVVFATDGLPKMLIECKAPEELLNEKVFEQIARYNLKLRVKYLWVTNGSNNFCCEIKEGIRLLEKIPAYAEL